MIKTKYGYQQTIFWIKEFEKEIEELKRKYLPHSPRTYRVYADGTLHQIEDLKKEIADYEVKNPQNSEIEVKPDEILCPICDVGTLENQVVSKTFKRHGQEFVYHGIKASCCYHCGERFLDGETVLKIEAEIEEKVKDDKST